MYKICLNLRYQLKLNFFKQFDCGNDICVTWLTYQITRNAITPPSSPRPSPNSFLTNARLMPIARWLMPVSVMENARPARCHHILKWAMPDLPVATIFCPLPITKTKYSRQIHICQSHPIFLSSPETWRHEKTTYFYMKMMCLFVIGCLTTSATSLGQVIFKKVI